MRKYLFILLLLVSTPVLGQYGLRVGPTLSTFRTSDSDQGYLLGYTFGSYLEVAALTERLTFSPEVAMSLLGSNGPEDNEISLLYLQVPMKLRYYLPNRSQGFYMEGGAGIGYLLSAEDESADTNADTEAGYTNFDFYVPLGIGYNGGSWGVTVLYHLGLSDISKQPGVSLQNSSFSVVANIPLFNGSFGGYQ